jgi:hypothetical protein
MATPITWQNITQAQPADSSRPLYFAQNAITNGLSAFGDALSRYEAGQDKLWKRQDTEATQALLDQMYKAQSLNEFNALNASGALDATRGANDSRIDRSAINMFRDARPGLLQQRQLDQYKFDDTLRAQGDVPKLAAAATALSKRDYEGAQAYLPELSPQGQSLLAKQIDTTYQEDVLRKRDADKSAAEIAFKIAQEKNIPVQAENQRITAQAAATNADANLRQAATGEKNAITNAGQLAEQIKKRQDDEQAGRVKLLTDAIAKFDAERKGSLSSSEGFKSALDEVSKVVKDPQELASLSQKMGEFAKDSRFANLTPAELAQATLASRETGWFNNTWFGPTSGSSLEKTLLDITKAPGYSARADRAAVRDAAQTGQLANMWRATYGDSTPAPGGPELPAAVKAEIDKKQIPAPTPPTKSPWTDTLLERLEIEKKDLNSGRIQKYSPEVQTAIDKDKEGAKTKAAAIEFDRINVSKAAGIGVPVNPATLPMPAGGDPRTAWAASAFRQRQQESYDDWAKSMDRRIELAKKAK